VSDYSERMDELRSEHLAAAAWALGDYRAPFDDPVLPFFVCTCPACPTQLDGFVPLPGLDAIVGVYARARHEQWRVEVSEPALVDDQLDRVALVRSARIVVASGRGIPARSDGVVVPGLTEP
jgi:hypothetical protein